MRKVRLLSFPILCSLSMTSTSVILYMERLYSPMGKMEQEAVKGGVTPPHLSFVIDREKHQGN